VTSISCIGELAVFVNAFEASGFTSSINWYRTVDRNWHLLDGVDPIIRQPALMIYGARDLVARSPRLAARSATRGLGHHAPGEARCDPPPVIRSASPAPDRHRMVGHARRQAAPGGERCRAAHGQVWSPASQVRTSPPCRNALGVIPVQRRNARTNEDGSVKPTRYAVSFTETLRARR